MNGEWTISWVWWITAVEVPALGCLFWMAHHGRREAERSLLRVYREIQANLSMVLENLAQSKLEVARLYATVSDLKDGGAASDRPCAAARSPAHLRFPG